MKQIISKVNLGAIGKGVGIIVAAGELITAILPSKDNAMEKLIEERATEIAKKVVAEELAKLNK